MQDGVEIVRRVWRAAVLRRLPLWIAGVLPWLALPSGPGLLAWLGWCAWDWANLRRRVAHEWPAWLDGAVPQLEDSSLLLVEAHTPVARLQRQRLLARIDASVGAADLRRIARSRVGAGLGWLLAGVAAAALVWFAGSRQSAPVAAASDPVPAKTAAASRPELLLRINPPKYTGVAPSESAPRSLQVPEQSQVSWCLKDPLTAGDVIELSDGRSLMPGKECARWTATESIFWRWRGERHTLRVIPDEAPQITVSAPVQMVHELAPSATSAAMAVKVEDDYAVRRATLHLTLARGSGENVRFTDREIPLPAGLDARRRNWSKQWTLAELGMEPGDELYFFVRATDNAVPAHTAQSPTYTLRLPAPIEEAEEESAAMPMLVKPESLRSQRQIIIDTEQLVADMKATKVDPATVRARSESIAADQGQLRRRYGQFLGEESTLFGGDDHDDEHGHDDDGKLDVLHQYGHAHDEAENATLYDEATKKILRRALVAMWDAEKALRAISPRSALAPEYKALEAIKELQQADRIYLHKTAFVPPPIKEEKRMTGDMVGAASYKREQDGAADAIPGRVRDLVQALAGEGALPALWSKTAHEWVRERIANDEQRLEAQRAIQDVADGCGACRPVLRAWLRGAAGEAPVLLQAKPAVETPFVRAWREGAKQ
jgi:hypothetical protein